MRIKVTKTTVYPFDELSEDAKEKAVQGLYDINLFSDWWENTFEDAKNVGITITEFDIDRGSYCLGSFDIDAVETAKKIHKEHGKDCETFKTAAEFLAEYHTYLAEDNEDCEDADYIRQEFRLSILEDYRIMLQKGYEYLASEEQIIESIKANDYEFTKDGKLA
jgi:hypothetical protein